MSGCSFELSNLELRRVPEGVCAKCLLPEHHSGMHLSSFKDTVDEKYVEWELDRGCGCEPVEDYCGCIIYSLITKEEAEVILKKKRA